MTRALLSSCLSLLATSLSAQVFVVDVNNGAGTHFTDLPTAAAAVPDGATLLVRAGTYVPFAIAGKGLEVVGEGEVELVLQLNATLSIRTTGPSQTVLMRNLNLRTWVSIIDCGGAVVFEGCRHSQEAWSPMAPPPHIMIRRSANVWFHACDLTAQVTGISPSPTIDAIDSQLVISRSTLQAVSGIFQAFSTSPPVQGGTPIVLSGSSRALIVASTIRGGNGAAGCITCSPFCRIDGGLGGTACTVALGSTLLALGSQMSGGTGGNGANCSPCSCCTTSGDGGVGLFLGGEAFLLGTTVRGGSGGVGGCRFGSTGARLAGRAPIVDDVTARTTSGWIDGAQLRGQTISFSLRAAAGSPALLLLSPSLAVVPLAPLAHGSMLATPAVFLGTYVVGSSGVLQIPLTLPASLPLGETYGAQFVSLDPLSAQLLITNPFLLLVHR